MSKKSQYKVNTARERILEARREREREQQRKYLWVAAAVVGVITVILLIGVIDLWFVRPAAAIAIVDGQTIRTDTYQKYVKFIRNDAVSRLQQLEQQRQQIESDPALAQLRQLIQQNINQAQVMLEAAPAQALEALIENELVKKEAAQRNISISTQEIEEEIQRGLASGKGWVTAPQATATSAAAITATATAAAQPTPTPSPVPTPAPGVTATTPTTPVVEPTAAPAHIMTPDEYKQEYANLQINVGRTVGWTEDEYKTFVQSALLRRKLSEVFASTVPTTAEQVRARHILTDTKEQADAILQRLKKGEPFEKVAAESSKDFSNKDQGGDLGWFPRGQMVKPFEDAAFTLKPNELSPVISTTFGYHIIQVIEGPVQRPLEPATLRQNQSTALSKWLDERKETLKKEGKLVSYYSPDKDPR